MRLKAFTLIELLIVVAIIAILAAIAVPNFLEAQVRAKVSRCKTDMRTYATGIEAYVVDNNKYPPFIARQSQTLAGAGTNRTLLDGPSVWYANTSGNSSRFEWITTPIAYITSVFQDPFIPSNVRFALNPNDSTPNLGYDCYDYIDARSSAPPPDTVRNTSGVAWTSVYRGASICSGAMWHICGCGPDRINAFGGNRNNNGALNIRELGADYDPTNGTISPGDIVRVGGGAGPVFLPAGGLPTFDRVTGKFNP